MKYFFFFTLFYFVSCSQNKVKFNSVPPPKTQVQQEIKRDFIGIEDSLRIAQLKLKLFSKHHHSSIKYVIISLSDLVWRENSEIWSIRPEFQTFIKQVGRQRDLKLVVLKDSSIRESRLMVKNLFFEYGFQSSEVEFMSERDFLSSSEITPSGLLMYLGSQKNALAFYDGIGEAPLLVYQLKNVHVLLPELSATSTQTAKND